jgi:hypothetical protein
MTTAPSAKLSIAEVMSPGEALGTVSFRRLAKGNKKAPGQAREFVKVRSKG